MCWLSNTDLRVDALYVRYPLEVSMNLVQSDLLVLTALPLRNEASWVYSETVLFWLVRYETWISRF